MSSESFYVRKLEKHNTKDILDNHVNGSLTVVWRDWDDVLKINPKMIYVSSVNPGEIKGPHIHKKRTSFFTCIHGKVVFILKEKSGNYVEIESNHDDPIMICVPNNIATAHINTSETVSRVLVMADIAWKPNDDEMINTEFTDYDWNKWKKL